jgi:mono/diheme cytochrome c family protein
MSEVRSTRRVPAPDAPEAPRRSPRWAALSSWAFVAGVGCAGSAGERPPSSARALEAQARQGAELYGTHCAPCHGISGRGDGRVAAAVFPRPRDLLGRFRLRSTPSGQPPSEEDLRWIIERGIPGAPMPGMPGLTDAQWGGLLAHLKRLSPALRAAPVRAALVPAEPAVTSASLAAGKALYQRLDCGDCHGADGRGDGEFGQGLVDDQELPCPPRDLVAGAYKGGSSAREIYVRLASGMDGTPMPAVTEEQVSVEERWQLAQYVASLVDRARAPALGGGAEPAVRARALADRASPDDPLDPAWAGAEALEVPVVPLWPRAGALPRLTVRALRDRQGLAVRLDWADPGRDERSSSAEFSDAAAVQLLEAAGDAFVGMGDPEHPVTLWHWRADWQRRLDEGAPGASRGPSPGPSTGPAAAASRTTPIEAGVAGGFGTFTARASSPGGVTGRGTWRAGRWYVVFRRALAGPPPRRLAFAIWDGALGDRAGQKLVSGWYPLVMEAPRSRPESHGGSTR